MLYYIYCDKNGLGRPKKAKLFAQTAASYRLEVLGKYKEDLRNEKVLSKIKREYVQTPDKNKSIIDLRLKLFFILNSIKVSQLLCFL